MRQRHGGDLGDLRTEVVAGHHVGAAGRRVVLDDVQYEVVTKNNTPMMTNMIGTTSANAASPMDGVIWVSISSVPYAEDEMQSGAKTPRAMGRLSRSPLSCSETEGFPRNSRLSR